MFIVFFQKSDILIVEIFSDSMLLMLLKSGKDSSNLCRYTETARFTWWLLNVAAGISGCDLIREFNMDQNNYRHMTINNGKMIF